jgi:hypothetical protein
LLPEGEGQYSSTLLVVVDEDSRGAEIETLSWLMGFRFWSHCRNGTNPLILWMPIAVRRRFILAWNFSKTIYGLRNI